MSSADERVAVVRRFNRSYTKVLGLLRDRLLETPYSLTEARVLFELAQRGQTDLSELRRELDLDAGYLSRILGRFEEQALVERTRSTADARRQVIRLTEAGRDAFQVLDARSGDEIRALLVRLSEDQQRRLIRAMREIEDIVAPQDSLRAVVLRPPRSGDFGWVVERHGAIYAAEYGWDETFEALVARIVADYIDRRDPKQDAAWIAEVEGDRVGCVFCMKKTDEVAQLRILLVEPSARGMGVGARLVDECIRFARAASYRRMMLWTNDVLDAARRIYERAGFKLVEENAHHSFGHDLIGQNWELEL
ncbi:MAG: helix-turn-helix domain-containing GNAT family N-acetyltransferase [Actinomycetota bacterium]|nr:helix-turn-helix domain-containing GNAT family N-acetyltransferase [Actinomycetota bacterium]